MYIPQLSSDFIQCVNQANLISWDDILLVLCCGKPEGFQVGF